MIKEKSQIWVLISKQLGKLFAKLPFPPIFYTWSTIPAGLVGMFFMIHQAIGLAIAFFLLAGLLDLIDGAVARHSNRTSYKGAFLDGSLDRFIDFMLIFSYFWLAIETPWLGLGQWICISIFVAIMPSFLVAYANHRQAVNDPHETVIWRILNRGEMYLLMLLVPFMSQYNAVWAGYLLVLFVILSTITTFQALFMTLYLSEKLKDTKE
jgi:CDP-diacylglycerol--glycerol-3-phosphate 3-phosphatidyltransferase